MYRGGFRRAAAQSGGLHGLAAAACRVEAGGKRQRVDGATEDAEDGDVDIDMGDDEMEQDEEEEEEEDGEEGDEEDDEEGEEGDEGDDEDDEDGSEDVDSRARRR